MNSEEELKTVGDQLTAADPIGMQMYGKTAIVGHKNDGLRLLSISYDKNEDIYSVGQPKTAFASHQLPSLKTIKLDENGNARLACLCLDKPPVTWKKNVYSGNRRTYTRMSYSSNFSAEPNHLVVSTAYGKIRGYDFRDNKKRPVWDRKMENHPISAIRAIQSNGNLIVGNYVGEVFVMEPGEKGQIIKKFTDGHGTITDIDLHPDGNHFCTSTVKHLRIYSLDEKKLVKEEFLYQKLEQCKFSSDPVDLDLAELEEEAPEIEDAKQPELFRDVLKQKGGKLTHNLVKLKYEKRVD